MIKAIFWDNDGVLVDTERLYFAATRQVLAGVGVELTEKMYVELILVQGIGAWHLAKERGLPADAVERLRDERNSLYALLLTQASVVMDRVREVLEALKGKYIMGIVTSSRRDHFEIIHRSSGLLPYFDFVLTGDDYARFKPDPEPYLAAVERSGCKKSECLAVEDSERGLASAKAAGIRCFVVPTELTRGGDFSRADAVLPRLKDIIAEIQKG